MTNDSLKPEGVGGVIATGGAIAASNSAQLSPAQPSPNPRVQCEGTGGAQLSQPQPNPNPRIQSIPLAKGSRCFKDRSPVQLTWVGPFTRPPGLVTMDSPGLLPSDSALLGGWIGGKFQGPGAGGLGGQSGDLGVMYYY